MEEIMYKIYINFFLDYKKCYIIRGNHKKIKERTVFDRFRNSKKVFWI
jgi:hypothetical protein